MFLGFLCSPISNFVRENDEKDTFVVNLYKGISATLKRKLKRVKCQQMIAISAMCYLHPRPLWLSTWKNKAAQT